MSSQNQQLKNLRKRLMTILSVAVFTGAVVLTISIYNLLSTIERTMWQSRQADAIHSTTVTVETFNRQMLLGLDILASFSEKEYQESQPELIAGWLERYPSVLEIAIFDQSADLITASFVEKGLLSDGSISLETGWFLAAQNGGEVIESVPGSADHDPYILFACKTAGGGVIAARIALDQLWKMISNIQLGESGITYIVRQSGPIVTFPDQQLLNQRVGDMAWQEWLPITEPRQERYINLSGDVVLGQLEPIPNTDWLVIAEVNQKEASYFSRFATKMVGVGSFVFGLITVFLIGHMLKNQIFERLAALRAGARRMAQGNFNEAIPIGDVDEIGELVTSFNDMSTSLRVRDSRIDAQNKALAEEVKDRKRAQENLQKVNNELIYASRYKDQFLATMSHELRTPLNAVLGMSEALLVPVYGDLNARQAKAIKHVRESGQHLLSIIDDILDLSKIAAGRSPLEIAPTSVKQVAESSIRMVRPIAMEKELAISVQIDPQISNIMADERRLKQILVNLLNNAVKFTHVGGEVGLEVNGIPEERTIEFVVFDTGIGIPENAIRQLFEPFMQVDGGLSRQYGGTGLGLTLVSRLVEMHEGVVEVDSTEGKGSRFTVSLPWREPQRGDPGDTFFSTFIDQALPSEANGAKILLAEDREANVLTLLDYLNIKGFEVLVARNGLEAVKMASDHLPDLILMDIQMPEMNGLEAIQHIRVNPLVQNIPIIALTALAMPGDRERCIAAGANDYVSKPVSLRQLVQTIEKHLADEEEVDEGTYVEPDQLPFLVHGM